jgi:membrane-bound serine protease (ClpP class)
MSAVLAGMAAAATEPAPPAKTAVVVIPVRDEIARPVLYILRRGLKEAIDQKADVIVLDIKTPGGALDVTFEIMEALDKFPGKTVAFVNNEAMSAGAFISAMTDEIWFTPDGIIGAAAPVMATGQDVDKTMKLKITSYLKARMRAVSEGKGYRGQVISAMIDEATELKIGDKVLKEKGELLSLTAKEASATYGEPAKALLAAGIAKNVQALLIQKFGEGRFTVKTLEITWSERLAVFLNSMSPVLLGLGMLALFIEFKTPGFGIFGISGIALLAVVFLGNYVAGLSGHEPILFFAAGLLLLGIEIFFVPGSVVIGLSGVALMLGSLVWSMADIWPNQPVVFSGDVFYQPIVNVGLGLLIAVVLALLLLRFLPRGWFWGRMVLNTAVSAAAQSAGGSGAAAQGSDTLIGRRAVVVTALRPFGHVEIEGRRHEARVEVGSVAVGETVVVRGRSDFGLIVEKAEA